MGGKTQIERERETTTTNNNTNTIIAWYKRDNARGIHKTNSAVPTPTNVSFSSSRLSLYTHIFRGNSTPKSSLSLSLSLLNVLNAFTLSLPNCNKARRIPRHLILTIALAFSLKSPVHFPCTSTRSDSNTSLRTNSISSSGY